MRMRMRARPRGTLRRHLARASRPRGRAWRAGPPLRRPPPKAALSGPGHRRTSDPLGAGPISAGAPFSRCCHRRVLRTVAWPRPCCRCRRRGGGRRGRGRGAAWRRAARGPSPGPSGPRRVMCRWRRHPPQRVLPRLRLGWPQEGHGGRNHIFPGSGAPGPGAMPYLTNSEGPDSEGPGTRRARPVPDWSHSSDAEPDRLGRARPESESSDAQVHGTDSPGLSARQASGPAQLIVRVQGRPRSVWVEQRRRCRGGPFGAAIALTKEFNISRQPFAAVREVGCLADIRDDERRRGRVGLSVLPRNATHGAVNYDYASRRWWRRHPRMLRPAAMIARWIGFNAVASLACAIYRRVRGRHNGKQTHSKLLRCC